MGGPNCYQRLITLGVVQQGSSLRGSYTCTFGNVACLGYDNSGNIVSGRMEGTNISDLRIAFSDASNRMYQGQVSASNGTGNYICFADGARITEEGSWSIKRDDR